LLVSIWKPAPCFANAEVGLAGHDAMMAWSIEDGSHLGVDLSGLSVVMVVNASDTLGFKGLESAEKVKSVILVDDKADGQQRVALVEFAKKHGGKAGQSVMRVDTMPIDMHLDREAVTGSLTAGKVLNLETRKARPEDCICSNESAYYPSLAKLDSAVPGVAIEGKFSGRGLGTRWSIPDSRSTYLGLFSY